MFILPPFYRYTRDFHLFSHTKFSTHKQYGTNRNERVWTENMWVNAKFIFQTIINVDLNSKTRISFGSNFCGICYIETCKQILKHTISISVPVGVFIFICRYK